MVDREMPRVQEVVLPLLRDALPGVMITSWIPDVDKRTFPLINVRRLGGPQSVDLRRLDLAVIEMTAYSRDGLVATENLYMDARQVLWDAWAKQIVTPAGYIHSFFQTMGPTQFDSPFEDTWRIQGLIQLGIRPAQN